MPLNEQRRTQLDGIVQQMVRNREPDKNIQWVVDDFKKKYEGEEVPQIETPKKKGIVRSIAEGIATPFAKVGVQAYNLGAGIKKTIQGDLQGANQSLSASRNLPGLGKVAPVITGNESFGEQLKKTAGTGLEIGSTVAGGGGVASIGKTTFKGLVKEGAKQGAKYGATTGLLSSTGQELQNKDASLKSVGGAALEGTIGGAVVGGALGGVSGGSGKLVKNFINRAENAKNKVSREAYDVIKPVLSRQESISAVEQGRAVKGKLGKIELIPTQRDLKVAKAVEGLVSKKNDFVDNVVAVRSAIRKEAKATLNGLKKHNADYDINELASHLGSLEKPPMVSTDARLDSAYNLSGEKFLQFAQSQKNDLPGLLKARQEFDNWIEKSFPKIFDDPNNAPLQTALRDMRSAANDFIASKLPIKNQFRKKLEKQNLMYEAISNMAEKNYKDVGLGVVKKFIKKHPTITKAAEVGVGGSVVGGAIKTFTN